jgi:hypothetical protein
MGWFAPALPVPSLRAANSVFGTYKALIRCLDPSPVEAISHQADFPSSKFIKNVNTEPDVVRGLWNDGPSSNDHATGRPQSSGHPKVMCCRYLNADKGLRRSR